MSIESQLVEMIASSLACADKEFVKDFVENGPIPGGVDGANRYLLAVAMRNVSAPDFAASTGVSQEVAQSLLDWLSAGTRTA
ncbi:TPA: hypothetical protein L4R50_000371 [Pseudomonas aeruginosa]|nr:hypothetical protein [Pseudomonas aeruginosa]